MRKEDLLLLADEIVPSFEMDSFNKLKKNKELLSIALQPYEIEAHSGEGIYIGTNKGLLMDFSSTTMNNILGQNDPWVKAHLIRFLLSDFPSYLTSRFEFSINYKAVEYISKIGNIKPSWINHKQCNGSDVTELSIKSAYQNKRRNGRKKLISFVGSFNGQNLTNFLVSDMKRQHLFFLDDTSMVEFIDIPKSCDNLELHTALTDQESCILEKIENLASEAFAIMLEPIQVNNDIHTFSIPFVKGLKQIGEEHGLSLIFDEIQTSVGWLGELSAAERYGVIPNVIALSKGLTGGNGPLAALISDKDHNNLELGSAEKTNGADIRSLVVCIAVLERILGIPKDSIPSNIPNTLRSELETGLLSNVISRSNHLQSCLNHIQEVGKSKVCKIKGDRLIRGIEFFNEADAEKAFWKLIDNGIWIRKAKKALIVKPPLIMTEEEMTKGTDIIAETIRCL